MPRPTDRDQKLAARRQAAQRAASERAARRRQWIAILVVAGMVLSTGGAIIAVALGGGSTGAPSTTTLPSPPEPITPAVPADLSFPSPGDSAPTELACPAEDGSSPRLTSFTEPPPLCLATLDDGTVDDSVGYNATIRTSEGDLVFRLHSDIAPETVNSFVVLARYHYFDGAPFDLAFPVGWVEAGGRFDDGSTGTSYTLPNETPTGQSIFTPGALAFAPTREGGSDPGRLIIALGENAADLPDFTTIFGLWLEPADGLGPFQAVTSENGVPTAEIRIESIDIETVALGASE